MMCGGTQQKKIACISQEQAHCVFAVWQIIAILKTNKRKHLLHLHF